MVQSTLNTSTPSRSSDPAGLPWGRSRRRPVESTSGGLPEALAAGGAAVLSAALAAASWLVALVVAAAVQGRDLGYPLAAVAAVFRGERALGAGPAAGELSTTAFVRGAAWTVLVALLLAGAFALVTRRHRSWGPVVLGSLGAVASLVLFAAGVVLLGDTDGPSLQRSVSSYEGLRSLGLPVVGGAHVLAGLVMGLAQYRRAS